MDIDYKIVLHSYWSCGSGLAAGADVDSLVIKDKNGMPYIPGKTIKGLLREAMEEYLSLTDQIDICKEGFAKLFGYTAGGLNSDNNALEICKSDAYFSNAELEASEYKAIVSNKLSEYMFKSVSSTAIEKDGIAKDHSLRKMEVVVPCTLYGKITDMPEDMSDKIESALGMIKCLGSSRSRGLGRCTFMINRKEQKA